MPNLLAVDLGVRTGLALYGGDGRLVWYRSRNFGSSAALKRGIPHILGNIRDLEWIVLEGGGPIGEIWQREAAHRGIGVLRITAEQWRSRLMYAREHVNGSQAKESAGRLARRIVEWSGARRPTSLRHDAAEAILIGVFGLLELRWVEGVPRELHP